MSDREQTAAFAHELERLIYRFRQEYEICYPAVIGCLQLEICRLAREADEEDDEE